jgi:hypothetical protein
MRVYYVIFAPNHRHYDKDMVTYVVRILGAGSKDIAQAFAQHVYGDFWSHILEEPFYINAKRKYPDGIAATLTIQDIIFDYVLDTTDF